MPPAPRQREWGPEVVAAWAPAAKELPGPVEGFLLVRAPGRRRQGLSVAVRRRLGATAANPQVVAATTGRGSIPAVASSQLAVAATPEAG